QPFVFVLFEFAAVQIDAIFRVNPVAMLVEQPIHTVGRAALFVGSQRENQIAVRQIPFLFQADEIGDQDGVAFLHVFGTAAVEVAVLLNEFEGIGGPVRTERFHDVEVPDEKNGLAFSGAAKTSDEIFLAFVGTGYFNVVVGETSVAQAFGHGLGSCRDVANGIGGVDFNKLLENIARQLLRLIRNLGSAAGRVNCEQTKRQDPACSSLHSFS